MKNEKQGRTVLHLSGDESWRLAIDPHNVGREEAWWNAARADAKKVRVPWIMQDAFPEYHGVAWYWRAFAAPELSHARERALLRFEAVDYLCEVWLNGVPVGGHEGGEGPFALDVTDAIRAGGDNLLAVRVLNPSHEPIDGIALGETPHRCKCDPYIAGGAFNHGGITAPVQLVLAPPVRLEDLWVRADAATGKVRVQARARNDEAHIVYATIDFSLASPGESATLINRGGEYSLAPGENVVEAELAVDDPQLWQLNEPNLYRVSCRLNVEDGDNDWMDERAVRCGFRDFRFENGYFRLNGKRLFLKGTHTLNHTPVGLQVPHDPDLLRRDLLNLKVMGFNMVRFIWGGAVPYQLDLCDEIGLLVYNESYASHAFSETSRMGALFDHALTEVVRRDRNHASVVIWGLLNEISDSPLLRHAAASLPLLRELDDTRMVMLNSGRWDKDLTLGSFSNPGSTRWDAMMGGEGATPSDSASTRVTPPPTPAAHEELMEQGDSDQSALLGIAKTMKDAPETIAESAGGIGANVQWDEILGDVADVGDAHFYPRVPQLPVGTEILRHLGTGSPQRIYLSEYGIGSAVDLWRVTRHYERMGATHAEDAMFYRDKLDRYLRDWKQWKLDEVFVAPPEFFAQSLAKMASQRTLGINAIRANPNLAGYSLTGAIDHVMCGEGLTTLFRELKPGTTDAIFEGFAPLRLCLFAEPPHLYRGGSLRLEAVLANEDALGAGDYRVQLQVVGPQMERVFQRTVTITVPERDGDEEAPFAIPFFDETIAVDGSPGKYRFVAFLEEGGAATGGETAFFVTDAAQMPPVEDEVVLWGEDANLLNWLGEHGIRARQFSGDENDEPRVLAVSRAARGAASMKEWRDLVRRIARGATVVFLSPEVFARDESPLFWLPLENKGEPTSVRGWLYLKDEWAKNHPIFDGLPAGGLLDYDFYRELIPDALYAGQDAPHEAIAGAIKASQDYDSGLMLAVYQLGAGRIVLNTMRITENLGSHPTAERLLRNLLRYAASTLEATAPPVALPQDFEETLARLYPPYPISAFKLRWQASPALPETPIAEAALPDDSLSWSELLADEKHFVSFFARDGHSSGLVYARGEIEVPQNMQVEVLLGPDGPCKAWLDDQLIGTVEYAQNPGSPDKHSFPLALTAGRHVITVAFHRRGGQAWGFFLRFKRTDGHYDEEELQTGQALLPRVDP